MEFVKNTIKRIGNLFNRKPQQTPLDINNRNQDHAYVPAAAEVEPAQLLMRKPKRKVNTKQVKRNRARNKVARSSRMQQKKRAKGVNGV